MIDIASDGFINIRTHGFFFINSDHFTELRINNIHLQIARDNYWKAKHNVDDEFLWVRFFVSDLFCVSMFHFYCWQLPMFSFSTKTAQR